MKYSNYQVRKVSDFEFIVQQDPAKGMEIPVSIYAHDTLASFMASDRAIDQAVNVKALQDIVGPVAVLFDGHKGYGFPIGGVTAVDMKPQREGKRSLF
jgi:tRNA-splicing ligase RtcB